jgi:hypothetical protein
LLVYKIKSDNSFEFLLKIESSINQLYQVHIQEHFIFLTTNFDNYLHGRNNNFVEYWNLLSGKKLKSFQPTCKYYL